MTGSDTEAGSASSPAGETYTLFAVVDADEGLFYETLDDTIRGAVESIDDGRKDGELRLRMATGKVRVHQVRVDVLGIAQE